MTDRHDDTTDSLDTGDVPQPRAYDQETDSAHQGREAADQDTASAAPVSRRTALTVGGIGLAGVLAMAAVTTPRPGGLGEATGDEALADALHDHLDGHRTVAAAVVDGDQVRTAGFGVDESTEFEIGSISKGFTGNLLALGIEKDGLALETTVAEVLGSRADGSPIADVTLQELTTHTAGLPPMSQKGMLGALWRNPLRKDPHGFQTVDDVIDGALATEPSGRGGFTYSNLGVGLLGQLLALAAGTDYDALLTERVLDPLQLDATYAPITPDRLRESAEKGRTAQGHRTDAWTLGGVAPSGGIRSTLTDMTEFLQAMLDESAPGAAAAQDLLFDEGDDQVAMNWFHLTRDDGPTIRWHNGMTGGYASFLGWIPEQERGVVLLSATARSMDSLALDLLTGEVTA